MIYKQGHRENKIQKYTYERIIFSFRKYRYLFQFKNSDFGIFFMKNSPVFIFIFQHYKGETGEN